MSKRFSHIKQDREKLFEGMGVPEQIPFVPDDFQQEAVSSVVNSEDTLVVAPTGSGKTFIATQAITACLQQGLRAVYTTPLKALSNTKFTEFKSLYEPTYKVGLLTGDRKIDGDASVVVATTEIYRNELYRGEDRYSIVILDEVHFIADPQRGPVWEEAIILTPSTTTLLMLSASISNAQEIADWISHVRGKPCRIVKKVVRPVALRFGFIHPEFGIIPLENNKGQLSKEVIHYYGERDAERSFNRSNRRHGR